MNFVNFTDLISTTAYPVILIEGRRAISESGAQDAQRLASMLAECFPNLRFRSGNAEGSDESFSSGVIAVAPERLEIIAPYATHRKRDRHPLVHYESPESLDSDALEAIQTLTITATPANRGLIKCYGRGGRTGAQAACLIRDTLKVTGIPKNSFHPSPLCSGSIQLILKLAAPDIRYASVETLESRLCFKMNGRLG